MARRRHRPEPSQRRASRAPAPQVLALALVGVGLLILGGVALIWLPGATSNAAAPEAESLARAVPVAVDFPAPSLELNDLEGRPVSLADYLGKVVLVNNWATWCPPCKAEMPTLQAYFQAHASQGFVVIAIEAGEPVQQVKDFAAEFGLTFPVWPDPEVRALRAFRNDTLPNSYVIDRSGQVRLAWSGAISLANLEKFVTPLLEE